MIKFVKVRGINRKLNCEISLHSDINVVTGMNGSGKTTLLKVIWYMISGNIERIPREMTFDEIYVETTDLMVHLKKKENTKSSKLEPKYAFKYKVGKEQEQQIVTLEEISTEAGIIRSANHKIARNQNSIFFSTFRRLEGGFSTSQKAYSTYPDDDVPADPRFRPSIDGPSIVQSLSHLSERLSVYGNIFVSSISTSDIRRLLTLKYAEVSNATNKNHANLSKNIFSAIKRYEELGTRSQRSKLEAAKAAIDQIASRVSETDKQNRRLLSPFDTLSTACESVFAHRGIRLTDKIFIGRPSQDAIESDALSSGEKQMLSFLCYNAFYSNIPIFIDEPELSLHTDWQRLLFPTLLSQKSSNQFIVATHSPFIYSRYRDKEIVLPRD